MKWQHRVLCNIINDFYVVLWGFYTNILYFYYMTLTIYTRQSNTHCISLIKSFECGPVEEKATANLSANTPACVVGSECVPRLRYILGFEFFVISTCLYEFCFLLQCFLLYLICFTLEKILFLWNIYFSYFFQELYRRTTKKCVNNIIFD